MGADGSIDIWREDKVRAAWPDCDNLFSYIPSSYLHSLEGTGYYHIYSGDNLMINWTDVRECVVFTSAYSQEFLDYLQSFIDWLQANIDASWEVWT